MDVLDLDQILKDNQEVNEIFLNNTLAIVKLKIQHLGANCDNLSPKELAKELKELSEFGKILNRHNRHKK